MNAFSFDPVPPAEVESLRARYLDGQVAPLDGMWLTFAQMAQAFLIRRGEACLGYCAVDASHRLLQFHVEDLRDGQAVFVSALEALGLSGAVVTTSDLAFLSLCMDHQRGVRVQALGYQLAGDVPALALPAGSELLPIDDDTCADAVEFSVSALGADRSWLESYYGGLVLRRELFGLWLEGGLIAVGEDRPSPLQPPSADLGMIVAADRRGQGIGSAVLAALAQGCVARGLRPICSTESGNPAAQRAIERAGFVSRDRILEVDFVPQRTTR